MGHEFARSHLTRRWRSLLGFDVSHNAVAALNAAAKHFGITEIHGEQMDLTAPNHPRIAALRGRVAYTYLSLEQLKYDTPAVIANILKGEPKRVFHVEPTPEILSLTHPRQLLNRPTFNPTTIRTTFADLTAARDATRAQDPVD